MLVSKLGQLTHDVEGITGVDVTADQGFTLIELLVVILIIGILAAIAIPSFLNQKGKANDANAKAIARTAQTAEETYFTDNQAYTGAGNSAALVSIEPTLSGPNLACTPATGPNTNGPCSLTTAIGGGTGATANNSFAVSVTSRTGVIYTITRNSDGTVARSCDASSAPNPGGCVASGW